MSSSERLDFSDPPEPPPAIRWRSWPLRESLVTAAVLLVGLLAAGATIHWITAETHLALLAVGALSAALWRFFLPTWFELNPEGVNRWLLGRHRRIPWREIRRYKVCSTGVLFLPHPEARPADAFRGLYLPWGKHRHEVLAHVYYHLDQSSGA